MRRTAHFVVLMVFVCSELYAKSPATLNNDDSCDVTVSPAATLLLPYFEVDLNRPAGETTLFTVTNVGPLPQIARVTIWTDWAFPVLTFNLFLTGYDVQSINLYDVLAHGRIAGAGTSSHSEVGERSAENDANPMHDVTHCYDVPDPLAPPVLTDLRRALTLGRTTTCAEARVGSTHERAIGYATIDVVQNCSSTMPVDAGYFTTEILFDNVLIGDYQQVNTSRASAQGGTLVHIRAIPEGGLAGWARTNFRRTFYSRLQNGGTVDRRQPLPSTFAARWVVFGLGAFNTSFKIWREGQTGAAAGCAVSSNTAMRNGPDVVRFDENENSTEFDYGCPFLCPEPLWDVPIVRRLDVNDNGVNVPPNPGQDLAGWIYFNLDSYPYPRLPDGMATQAWVIVSMANEARYSVDFDATPLGNGCSPRAPFTASDGSQNTVGPAPNVNPGSVPNP